MGVYLTDVYVIGVHLMGVYLIDVHLSSMYLMGVYLTGVHLMGVYVINVHLTGVHLMGLYLTVVDLSRSELQNTSFCASCGVVPMARRSLRKPWALAEECQVKEAHVFLKFVSPGLIEGSKPCQRSRTSPYIMLAIRAR
jgi:hypothetical protein